MADNAQSGRRSALEMKAILSDIHGNLEALEAVLADIRSRGIPEIVFLGDTIGYGPDPLKCMEITVREADTLICGNHEEAVFAGDASGFNQFARRAVEWTRDQLLGEYAPEGAPERCREMFGKFQLDANIEGIRYVHGSPRKPTKEYITPRDVRNTRKMAAIFDALETVCFIGHTHIPGVFTEDTEEGGGEPEGSRSFKHEDSEELFGVYMLGDEKALINVGSVGQPRDSDPRACYATFDVDTVVFRRVEYDIDTVVAKIRSAPLLDNSLGERLRLGR